jgi:hypothetical protein
METSINSQTFWEHHHLIWNKEMWRAREEA